MKVLPEERDAFLRRKLGDEPELLEALTEPRPSESDPSPNKIRRRTVDARLETPVPV